MNGPENSDHLEAIRQAVNASPFYRLLHMRVESCEAGRSRFVLEADQSLTNIFGSLHGGGLAALIDSACGLALASRLDPSEVAVTMDLSVKYLRPAYPGRLAAAGTVIYRGRTVGVEEAEVFQEKGELLAKGTVIHLISKRTT